MPTRSAQIPSLRILPSERKLIEAAAKARGQTVTNWAREQLIRLAEKQTSPEKPKALPVPKPTPKVPESESKPIKRKGLELDEETRLLLAGYAP